MTRVLHVATIMGSGGLEKWLVDLVAEMNSAFFESHILVQSDHLGLHGRRARDLGLSVITLPDGHRPLQFSRKFFELLKERGPFDVVHSHVHTFSGLVLSLARMAGVPVRIAHAHNDTSRDRESLPHKLYGSLFRRLISWNATHGFGVSNESAVDLFGREFGRDRRWQVLPCGISLEPFRQTYDRSAVRAELGIPDDALVLTQVGRLTYFKNQEFSIGLLARLLAESGIANPHLLLLGEGELEERCRKFAMDRGVADRVIFAGARSDIPRILDASDLFLFPSKPGEGAPIALIEAQAAGLPCLISEHIPTTSIVVKDAVRPLSIEGSLEPWVAAVSVVHPPKPAAVPDHPAAVVMEKSNFSIKANHLKLATIYNRMSTPTLR